jgi:hypothetical protein
MPTAVAPIRLDRDLAAAAREEAQAMSRSVAEQVSHWARLGRELERSPHVSVTDVQAVLRGTKPYDALNAQEQAVVRATWEEGIQATLAGLDLSASFAVQGHRYAELDDHGQLRIVGAS